MMNDMEMKNLWDQPLISQLGGIRNSNAQEIAFIVVATLCKIAVIVGTCYVVSKIFYISITLLVVFWGISAKNSIASLLMQIHGLTYSITRWIYAGSVVQSIIARMTRSSFASRPAN
ncbi:MAG: hypothetical protein LBI69_02240 [Puniceicoccales bacterium]|jgi:hypothetical protein|nr:hypothetical protein [Puniceicoccales bacterium]